MDDDIFAGIETRKYQYEYDAPEAIARAAKHNAKPTFGHMFGKSIRSIDHDPDVCPKTADVRRAVTLINRIELYAEMEIAKSAADTPTRGKIAQSKQQAKWFRAAWEAHARVDLFTGEPISTHKLIGALADVPREFIADAKQMYESGVCEYVEARFRTENRLFNEATEGACVSLDGTRRKPAHDRALVRSSGNRSR